ncbi:MAG: tRNA (adenosine(37)-N6)-dimethylallyltransferase MiaA [Saprospiraceae bacterium]|nr:tRNA (adenosine(37)-N6)-dimethylallyltransferase MiaA [Saprospiraceae bacterium]
MSKQESTKYLIVIGGPTAIGKTEVALNLAVKYDCPIFSADSRQFYKEMNIGTAKPSADELGLAKHHFINNLSIHDEYSVGQYEKEAINALDKIYKENDIAILVGGTGLYINAILEGLDDFPKVDADIKLRFNRKFRMEGIISLQSQLKEQDPAYAEKVDINNPHRLIRALSVIESSGKTFTSFLDQKTTKRTFKPIKIALTMERHLLYDKINKRVDRMFENGLVDEVKSLFEYRHLNALNTVGYSEIFEHLEGKCFISESIEMIKQNTRRYAKRQSTWFRNQGEWSYVESTKLDKIEEFVNSQFQ